MTTDANRPVPEASAPDQRVPGTGLTADPLDAAAVTAARLGLRDVVPRLLAVGSEAVIALDPLPLVARVCTVEVDAQRRAPAGRQVEIAVFAAGHQAPLVGVVPGIDPGPHRVGDRLVTLWERVLEPRQVPPAEAGRALRELHRCLQPYAGELESCDPRAYARAVADSLPAGNGDSAAVLRDAAAAYAPPALPAQLVHGDAHLGNVLSTPGGPRWIDLEDMCRGPVEWDLACIAHRATVFGDRAAQTRAVLAGYGDDAAERAGLMAAGVALYVTARTARAYITRPDLEQQLTVRLAWLREHLRV